MTFMRMEPTLSAYVILLTRPRNVLEPLAETRPTRSCRAPPRSDDPTAWVTLAQGSVACTARQCGLSGRTVHGSRQPPCVVGGARMRVVAYSPTRAPTSCGVVGENSIPGPYGPNIRHVVDQPSQPVSRRRTCGPWERERHSGVDDEEDPIPGRLTAHLRSAFLFRISGPGVRIKPVF